MMVKVFQTNEKGKIEFTRCELEKLLNEVYRNGYACGENEGRKQNYIYTYPYTYLNYTDSLANLNANSDTKTIDNFTCEIKNPANIIVDYKNTSKECAKSKETKEPEKTNRAGAAIFTQSSTTPKIAGNDFDKIISAIDEIFGSSFIAQNSVSESSASNNPFTSLAKELNNL